MSPWKVLGGPSEEPLPASVLAVVSGKGGVGKTNLVANLAIAAAGLGGRVLLVDGDLGLANVDVLLGLSATRSVADVLEQRASLEDALVTGPRGVRILPAASGRADLPALRPGQLHGLLEPLLHAARDYDLVLIDAGAGVGPTVVSLCAAAERALLVTTPEPTSLADAYATRKVLALHCGDLPVDLVVNAAASELEARDTHRRLEHLGRRFLGLELPLRACLPHDRRLAAAVARQRAAVEASPGAPWSRKLIGLARELLRDARRAGSTRRRTPPSHDSTETVPFTPRSGGSVP